MAVTTIKTVLESHPVDVAEKKSLPVVFQLVTKGYTDVCHPRDVMTVRTVLGIHLMDVTKEHGSP